MGIDMPNPNKVPMLGVWDSSRLIAFAAEPEDAIAIATIRPGLDIRWSGYVLWRSGDDRYPATTTPGELWSRWRGFAGNEASLPSAADWFDKWRKQH